MVVVEKTGIGEESGSRWMKGREGGYWNREGRKRTNRAGTNFEKARAVILFGVFFSEISTFSF